MVWSRFGSSDLGLMRLSPDLGLLRDFRYDSEESDADNQRLEDMHEFDDTDDNHGGGWLT